MHGRNFMAFTMCGEMHGFHFDFVHFFKEVPLFWTSLCKGLVSCDPAFPFVAKFTRTLRYCICTCKRYRASKQYDRIFYIPQSNERDGQALKRLLCCDVVVSINPQALDTNTVAKNRFSGLFDQISTSSTMLLTTSILSRKICLS